MIFDLYLGGKSILGIVKELKEGSIKSPTGKENWPKHSIEEMLRNEKYIGVSVANVGSKEGQIYKLNISHPAIISKEMFDTVQKEKHKRSNAIVDENGTHRSNKKYGSRSEEVRFMLLSNLNELKNDMVSKNWTICSFLFRYKSVLYIVLVKRFVGKEKRVNQYALVKLHFMKRDDLNDGLEIEANSYQLLIDAKSLRQYFDIEYQYNLRDILKQFTETFGKVIPMNISKNISDEEKRAMVKSLSISDSEDPNKIYCYKIKRNPNGGKRSDFNSDKTKLLRTSLFRKFENEPGVSFCYSDDPLKEKDDSTILCNFSK